MDTVGVEDPVRVYPGQMSCPDAPLWMLSDDEVDRDLAALDRAEARLVARRVQLPFHHRLLHRQGWRVVLAANGRPAVIPPASIDPERRPRQHHRFDLIDLTRRRRT